MIGGLLYCTRFLRSDLAFVVNKMSGHQGYVTKDLLCYVRRIIRYAFLTRDLSLFYDINQDSEPIRAFVDASHAPDAEIRLIIGFAMFHFGNLVDWGTRRQRTAAKSSTEAEITAVCDFLDSIWVPCALIKGMTGENIVAKVYEDNISALCTLEGGSEKNLRWAVIRAKYVREAIDSGQIEMISIPGEHQIADLLTKTLDHTRFESLRAMLLKDLKIDPKRLIFHAALNTMHIFQK